MDSELKTQWLTALRSGEYEQGSGMLGTTHYLTGKRKHCCLGVLCEIEAPRLIAAGIQVEWRDGVVIHVDDLTNYPSNAVCEALGLPPGFWRLEGMVNMYDGSNPNLDRFNDHGLTFAQIADVIEWAL